MKSLVKILLIFNLIISPFFLSAQTDSLQTAKKTNGFIAVDLFSPVYGLFADKKGAEIMITYPIFKKIHLAVEGGYEENKYDKNRWNASSNGPFIRVGAQYFISQDDKNPNMGFYLGGRFGYSIYKQTVHSTFIKGSDDTKTTTSLPEHNASAVWFAPMAGGRVQVMESPFYFDASVRLNINLYQKNDYGIDALTIPGYGTDQGGLTLGVNWSVGYALPF